MRVLARDVQLMIMVPASDGAVVWGQLRSRGGGQNMNIHGKNQRPGVSKINTSPYCKYRGLLVHAGTEPAYAERVSKYPVSASVPTTHTSGIYRGNLLSECRSQQPAIGRRAVASHVTATHILFCLARAGCVFGPAIIGCQRCRAVQMDAGRAALRV